MYSLPPAVLFNEQTGRLELCHAEIARRMRRTTRLRSRYRSMLTKRLIMRAFGVPWRAGEGTRAYNQNLFTKLDASLGSVRSGERRGFRLGSRSPIRANKANT